MSCCELLFGKSTPPQKEDQGYELMEDNKNMPARNPPPPPKQVDNVPKKAEPDPPPEQELTSGSFGANNVSNMMENPILLLKQFGYEKLYLDSAGLGFLKKVGKGISGTVYEATMGNNRVAVKCITMDQSDGKLQQRVHDFVSEISAIQKLNHPNILRLLGVSFAHQEKMSKDLMKNGNRNDDKSRKRKPSGRSQAPSQAVDMLIVTDFCAMGTLQQLLIRKSAKKLSLELQVKIALEIAQGMAFTHGQKILHRDLKPDNVLLAHEGNPFSCKIADFGLAKAYGLDDFTRRTKTGDIGTPIFMAPELLFNDVAKYDGSIDVYAYGIVLYMVHTQLCPYIDVVGNVIKLLLKIQKGQRPTLTQKVLQSHPRKALRSDLHPGMEQLINACWDDRSDRRPKFSQIVRILEDPNFLGVEEEEEGEQGPLSEEQMMERIASRTASRTSKTSRTSMASRMSMQAVERLKQKEKAVVEAFQAMNAVLQDAGTALAATADPEEAYSAMRRIVSSMPPTLHLFVWEMANVEITTATVVYDPSLTHGSTVESLQGTIPSLPATVEHWRKQCFGGGDDSVPTEAGAEAGAEGSADGDADAGGGGGEIRGDALLASTTTFNWPREAEKGSGGSMVGKLARIVGGRLNHGAGAKCIIGCALTMQETQTVEGPALISMDASQQPQLRSMRDIDSLRDWAAASVHFEEEMVNILEGTKVVARKGARILLEATDVTDISTPFEEAFKTISVDGYTLWCWCTSDATPTPTPQSKWSVIYHPWLHSGVELSEVHPDMRATVDKIVSATFTDRAEAPVTRLGNGDKFGAPQFISFSGVASRSDLDAGDSSAHKTRKVCHAIAVYKGGKRYLVGSHIDTIVQEAK